MVTKGMRGRLEGARLALRSLRRVRANLKECIAFRRRPGFSPPGSVEMGVLLGLEDGLREVDEEIERARAAGVETRKERK